MTTPYQVDAQQMRCSTNAYGGMSLTFQTQELSSEEDMLCIIKANRLAGTLFFSPEKSTGELKKAKTNPIYGKTTPSQRLRLALMNNHEVCIGEAIDFELYYHRAMERIIAQVDRRTEEKKAVG